MMSPGNRATRTAWASSSRRSVKPESAITPSHGSLDLAFFAQGRLRSIRRLNSLGVIDRLLQMSARLGEMLGRFVLAKNDPFPRCIAEFVLHLMQRLKPLRNAVEQVVGAHDRSDRVA